MATSEEAKGPAASDALDLDGLEATWRAYDDRMHRGDGNGSVIGASYIIASSAPGVVLDLIERLRAAEAACRASDDMFESVDDDGLFGTDELIRTTKALESWRALGQPTETGERNE